MCETGKQTGIMFFFPFFNPNVLGSIKASCESTLLLKREGKYLLDKFQKNK